MEDVTCFGDTNKVYIPGLKDCEGRASGASGTARSSRSGRRPTPATPGTLSLQPNNQEPGILLARPRVPERVD